MGLHVLEKEIVRISGWGSKQDYRRHDIVLEKTSRRRVERPIASEKLGKWQDALATKFLDN